MLIRFKNPLEYFQKNKNSFKLASINQNAENDPDFVIYDTTEFVPNGNNYKHFASLASVLSVENGYFGTRSCLEECYCGISTGATYIAGIYMVNNDLKTDKLAVMPDWTRTFILIDDEPLDLLSCEVLEHKRGFDIKRGVSVRNARLRDSQGRITLLNTEKFASLSNKHLGGHSISIIPENYSAKITVRTGLDGNVINVDYADYNMKTSHGCVACSIYLPEKEFKDGEINAARKIGMARTNFIRSESTSYRRYSGYEEDYVFEEYDINGEKGKEILINSIISIHTSLDSDNAGEDSRKQINAMKPGSYEKILNEHAGIMQERLNDTAIVIGGDKIAQRYANYSVARLVMAGEHNSEKTSIAARTLTGPSYAGHVFWDNEIFDLPFFIYTNPKAARTMLMYRYNTLEGARENRRIENDKYNTFYKGARFAWESTSSGLERTPEFVTNDKGEKVRIFTGTNEKHITPDVAYATYKYWQATGDDEFMRKYGAEIIFETARYSASILHEAEDGKLHTKNVIGPDEYHEEVALNPVNGFKEGVNDNAYTNILIKHNLEIAVKTAKILENRFSKDYEELKTRIILHDDEIRDWIKAKNRIYINQDAKTSIIEQFEGFSRLKNLDLNYFRKKYGEVNAQKFDQVLLHEYSHNKKIDPDKNNYNVLKQPDVLMFMALLPENYSHEVQLANYEEYEPKTSHGSSLSAGIHSLMAARLGKIGDAYKYYLDTGGMDIDNVMGNAANGIHAASLGATWQALIMGFGGVQFREEALLLRPNLPQIWNQLGFGLKWHGQDIGIHIKRKFSGEQTLLIKVSDEQSKTVPVKIGDGSIKYLMPGFAYSAVNTPDGWIWGQESQNKPSVISGIVRSITNHLGVSTTD